MQIVHTTLPNLTHFHKCRFAKLQHLDHNHSLVVQSVFHSKLLQNIKIQRNEHIYRDGQNGLLFFFCDFQLLNKSTKMSIFYYNCVNWNQTLLFSIVQNRADIWNWSSKNFIKLIENGKDRRLNVIDKNIEWVSKMLSCN